MIWHHARTSALLLVTACVAPAAPSPRPVRAPVAPPCLSIGAWNDLHGQIGPDDPVIDTGPVPAGGVIALADAIADLRATGDTVVLLDAGDLFTGPLESTMSEGAPIIEAYRVLGVDAAAVGNHEFDFGPVGYDVVTAPPGTTDAAGPRGPRGALLARMAAASFPFLSSNVQLTGGGAPAWPNFAAAVHVRRGGFDVGVVGYTTEETPTTTSRPNVADLDFTTHAAAAVAAQIRALRAAGASPIVLLAHASLDGVLPQQLDEPADPHGTHHHGELATLVAALGTDRPDVILAGHRHAWMLGRLAGIPIVSSDQRGVGLARLRFCRAGAPAARPPALVSIDRAVVLAAAVPRTPLGAAVARAVAPWVAAVRTTGEARVATLPRACAAQAVDGTATAEQVARAIAAHVADAAVPPAGVPLVGVTNAGALRAPLNAGPLRYADLFRTYPFESTVAVCGTTRAGLARLLQNALADPSTWKHFPFALAGAHVTIARSTDGTATLAGVALDGDGRAPVAGDAPVWLALPDFVLDGGDGLLDGVPCTPAVRSTTRIRDAWRELLAREPEGCEGPPRNLTLEAPR